MKKQEQDLFRWQEELDEVESEKQRIFGGGAYEEEVI